MISQAVPGEPYHYLNRLNFLMNYYYIGISLVALTRCARQGRGRRVHRYLHDHIGRNDEFRVVIPSLQFLLHET